MSTAHRYPNDLGYAGLCLTADEFLSLGETAERYELIHGVVVMSPSPAFRHQLLLGELIRQISAHAERHGGRAAPEIDVRFAEDVVYRPDLVYYRAGRIVGLPDRLTIPPDLAVEILSPGSRALDLVTKRNDYERFGVGEYWVIDPGTARPRCWSRGRGEAGRDGGLVEFAVAGDSLFSPGIAGLSLDLASLRGAIEPE